jgi:opacity protein-like surface antigen
MGVKMKSPVKVTFYLVMTFLVSFVARAPCVSAQELTLDASYYAYEEIVSGAFFMEVISAPAFYSLGVRDWDLPDQDWSFGLIYTLDLTYGVTDYASASSGTNGGEPYYKARFEAYGDYRVNEYFTPFIGLGYRRLFDKGEGTKTSTGHTGYDRLSEYLYAPIGVLIAGNDKLSFKAQYNLFIHGTQTSYIYGNIVNDQNNGWGFDSTTNYKITDDVTAYSFYRYWDIEDSTTNASGDGTHFGYEPQNTTKEIGVGLAFKF